MNDASTPAADTSAAGEWTAEHVKDMLDSWGHLTNLPASEYERIANEHNADARESLATLREQLAQAELLDNKIADELESWQLRAQTAEAALARAQQEREEAREQWRLFRIAADKAIARAEAAESACRLKDDKAMLARLITTLGDGVNDKDVTEIIDELLAIQPNASALQTGE